jgi:D-serine deaminase-like pyridoxal phosphate-dependent protein
MMAACGALLASGGGTLRPFPAARSAMSVAWTPVDADSPRIGGPKTALDTPALCLDLDAVEANIRAMAGFLRDRGKSWRPHAKGHKCVPLALKELAAGAMGLTVGKVSEAEVFAQAGVWDILIANMIVGPAKWNRVAALCRLADPIVACDHYAQIEPLARVCREWGVECRAIVEVDIGMERVGARPGRDTLELAQAIDRLEGVRLAGIMGYEGHLLRLPDADEKSRRVREAMGVLEHCRDLLLKSGLECGIVSAGGTGSYQLTANHPVVTELQAGGGLFGDPFYTDTCGAAGLRPAMTVLATVVSRGALDRAVVDSGRKTTNGDVHMPLVKGYPDARVVGLSAEHGKLELGPQSQELRIGDKIELVVGYGDFTTVLHDAFHVFRGDRLEAVWPIAGRGKLT